LKSNSDTDKKIKLIAEIGINHEGIYEIARDLVESAARAGADYVKFQYRSIKRTESWTCTEIGDSIISPEVRRNYISPDVILELTKFAHNLGVGVGISFFSIQDTIDFGSNIDTFDFFKIPSAELLNLGLINQLLSKGRLVLISTGAHSLKEIALTLDSLKYDNWVPLYCVSNYPVALHNIELEKLNFLRKWNRGVGYSSHDIRWETILLTLGYEVSFIERHIRLENDLVGLDKSSSSTPAEFEKLAEYLSLFPFISRKQYSITPNQGELINLQNLGQSFYAAKDLPIGAKLSHQDLVYRPPRVGIHLGNFSEYEGLELRTHVPAGKPLTESCFSPQPPLPKTAIRFLNSHQVGIPVRCHDYKNILDSLELETIEFHLSFDEISTFEQISVGDAARQFTVHLPDYLNPNHLINPFSRDDDIKRASLDYISRIIQKVSNLQDLHQKQIAVTGSFPSQDHSTINYFESVALLVEDFRKRLNVNVLPQWLPPFAWYFGGSYPLKQFNNFEAIEFIEKYELDICLDISHFILSANFEGFDPLDAYHRIKDRVGYFHLGGASGVDGEGKDLEESLEVHEELFQEIVFSEKIKICEVWQGHLNDYKGFRDFLVKLANASIGESLDK